MHFWVQCAQIGLADRPPIVTMNAIYYVQGTFRPGETRGQRRAHFVSAPNPLFKLEGPRARVQPLLGQHSLHEFRSRYTDCSPVSASDVTVAAVDFEASTVKGHCTLIGSERKRANFQ